MTDTLLLVTQVSSTVAFVIIAIAVIMGLMALSKFTGNSKFKMSILFLVLYLASFLLAIGFMSAYHWLNSDLMINLWYITLFVGLLFGVISGIFSLSFWRRLNFEKKK